MMKHIFTELHYYDEKDNYVPFDFEREEPFWAIQRKVIVMYLSGRSPLYL